MQSARRFRLSAVLDTIVVTAVLAGINYLWFRHDPAFRSWSIHPYLLPLALVGLFYGFREGLAAILVVNLVYSTQIAAAGLPWHVLLERPDVWNLAVFLLGGLFFGEAGELYQRSLRHHRDRAASLELALKDTEDDKSRLTQANRELQEWVRFGDVQLTEIHSAAPDLFSSDESKILETIAPLAQKILNADQCSLYWYDRSKERFWRRYQAGRNGISNPATISGDATPFAQLQQGARLVSVRDVETFSTGVRFLAAAPIMFQGAVQGALLLESMPLVRLSPYTLSNFGIIVDIINRSLDNAAALREGTGRAAHAQFRERIEQEVNVSNRYKAALSLLYIDIDDYPAQKEKLGEESTRQIIDQITRTVSRLKRGSDVLSYQGRGRFALLMPQTAPERTNAIIERTREELRAMKAPGSSSRGMPSLLFHLAQNTLTKAGLKNEEAQAVDESPGR
jgi:diguanylate cyclase (GGDEF)-like protein